MTAFTPRLLPACTVLLLVSAVSAPAAGLLVPTDRSLPPLAIQSHRVSVQINNGAATTTVRQVFANRTDRDLEAEYVFPLPRGAAINDFSMTVGGKKVKGELVERTKARQIYQSIVAQMKDPGLLEYMDNGLLKISIYPVPRNGTQEIELTYSEVLPADAGVVRYTYPLRSGEKASRTMDDFTLSVRITSAVPMASVVSPTHQVAVTKKSPTEASCGFELNNALLDRDFRLMYTLADQRFGLNMVASRREGESGYALLLLAPRVEAQDRAVPRDVVFVLDVSGSMRGEKFEQARAALRQCLASLGDADRFNLVAFSTDVTPLFKGLREFNDDTRREAKEWIDQLRAEGGTNIHDALAEARRQLADAADARGRLPVLLFMTDGRPTVGKTDDPSILSAGEAAAKREEDEDRKSPRPRPATASRVFTFGVGHDVNTKLLDLLAEKSGGASTYIEPKENIEDKTRTFFAKISRPAMTDVRLELPEEAGFTQVFPRPDRLPDLYQGSQVVLLGKYSGHGSFAVTLRGRTGEREEKFVYEFDLPKRASGADFIEPLWAQRRVGHLLNEIRLHGESGELKDEVIRLSTRYNIQTPYTSYLVTEPASPAPRPPGDRNDERPLSLGASGAGDAAMPAEVQRRFQDATSAAAKASSELGDGWAAGPNTTPAAPGGEKGDAKLRARDDLAVKAERAGNLASFLNDTTGEAAVAAAQYAQGMREAGRQQTQRGLGVQTVRVGETPRQFFQYQGFWLDERFAAGQKITKVKFGSEAYFKLQARRPELVEAFKIGTALVVSLGDKQAVAISETDGAETLTDAELDALLAG